VSTSDFFSAAQIGMPQLATPAAPGSLVESAVSAGLSRASGVSLFRHFGLAMRFKVEVGDLDFGGIDLGNWTSCEGLKVEFKFDPIRSGGDYSSTHILPQSVAFGPVTLKRAVERQYSAAVQEWLRMVAAEWQSGTDEFTLGTTVTISLLDVYLSPAAPAATWQLRNAFPISWSGPSMSAKSSEIASETLVLDHDGFLDPPE
jgi:phage tail-like protein